MSLIQRRPGTLLPSGQGLQNHLTILTAQVKSVTYPGVWEVHWEMRGLHLTHFLRSLVLFNWLSRSAGKQDGEKTHEDLKTGSDLKWQCKFILCFHSLGLVYFPALLPTMQVSRYLCVMAHVGRRLSESVIWETCWGWAHSQGSAYS